MIFRIGQILEIVIALFEFIRLIIKLFIYLKN